MKKTRLIARIDVKNEFVIKGIHLEGLRKVGNPNELAKKYYEEGIDEIIFIDAVASLYERNNLFHILERACKEVFIPITIGGGLRSISDIDKALKAGADKIALNTQAVKTPEIVKEAARIYGSQCIVASIEAKKSGNSWEAYTNNGRERTGIDVFEWIKRLEDLGAGEIFLTSVDKEGTKQGFEDELMKRASELAFIPVIANGGAGSLKDIKRVRNYANIDAIALASLLHYNIHTIAGIKKFMSDESIPVRL